MNDLRSDVVAWVVDVGNTRTSFAAVDAAGALSGMFHGPTPRSIDAEVRLPTGWPKPAAIHAASVVAEAVPALERALASLAPVVWWGTVERPVPIRHPYAAPAVPGADRLLAALGAHARCGGPVVVVDAGSALTCDLVGADGAFLGGAIAPGLRALVSGLAASAPALPFGVVGVATRFPGTSTQAAVDVGVTSAARGLVRELVLRAEEAIGKRCRLLVTGGDAAIAAAYLADRRPEIVPALVLEALALLARRT